MRVPHRCMACGDTGAPVAFNWHDMNDSNILVSKCSRGHTSRTVLEVPRYALLFDSALLAWCDGYYRESVASFASALEDFYLFYIRAVLLAQNEATVEEDLKKILHVFRRSEARLGAAAGIYAVETGKPFSFDVEARRTFRNKVVHDGSWPSSDAALDYGNYVFGAVVGLGRALEERRPGATERARNSLLFAAHRAASAASKNSGEPNLSTGTQFVSTLLWQSGEPYPARPFDDLLDEFKTSNAWAMFRHWESTGEGPRIVTKRSMVGPNEPTKEAGPPRPDGAVPSTDKE